MKNPSKKIKNLLDINGPKIRELKEKIARQEVDFKTHNSIAKEIIGNHLKRLKKDLKKLQ